MELEIEVSNEIGDIGASAVGDGIGNLSLLTYLYLHFNRNSVGDTGG